MFCKRAACAVKQQRQGIRCKSFHVGVLVSRSSRFSIPHPGGIGLPCAVGVFQVEAFPLRRPNCCVNAVLSMRVCVRVCVCETSEQM